MSIILGLRGRCEYNTNSESSRFVKLPGNVNLVALCLNIVVLSRNETGVLLIVDRRMADAIKP
jgi:hypothetical protein